MSHRSVLPVPLRTPSHNPTQVCRIIFANPVAAFVDAGFEFGLVDQPFVNALADVIRGRSLGAKGEEPAQGENDGAEGPNVGSSDLSIALGRRVLWGADEAALFVVEIVFAGVGSDALRRS